MRARPASEDTPNRGLPNRSEYLGKEAVEVLAAGEPLPEPLGLRAQLIVGERLDRRLETVDRVDIFAERTDIAVVGRSEDALCHCGEHEIPLRNPGAQEAENLSRTLWESVAGDVRSALAVVN